jgi:flagellar P-ring protein precursor FlgI
MFGLYERLKRGKMWQGGKICQRHVAYIAALSCCLLLCLSASAVLGARIKDIASIQGMRDNQLFGYGLVVGLAGTGDGTQAKFTMLSIANMMERMGIINVDPQQIKVKNAAGVIVTAQMPPFAKNGQKLDVVVSSIGDAKSLQGGTLLMTPLKGVDGKVYAIAQGPVSIGGFAAGGQGGNVQKNHPTAGRIANGATVEREIPVDLNRKEQVRISLYRPDFTTVSRMVDAINDVMGVEAATAVDPETVSVRVPLEYRGSTVSFIASLENIEIEPDQKARIVLDERTGTVVMGSTVHISTVAIAHGNLSIRINENPQVSQPNPLGGGQTVTTPGTNVNVKEGGGEMVVLNGGATIGDLVSALNAIGVTPRDLISILGSIKAAGALQADIEVI